MNKRRIMIGKTTLDKAIAMHKKMIPIATIAKVLELDKAIHYRTVFDIIKADRDLRFDVTRPEWLKDEPYIQKAPEGWHLIGGIFGYKAHWIFKEVIH